MAGLLPCVPRVTGAACGQSLALRSLSQFPAARGSFYDVLEVSPSATQDEVKAAYYKLSKSHHPDMNPGNPAAEARFGEISEAYNVLSKDALRARYDKKFGLGSAAAAAADDIGSNFRGQRKPGALDYNTQYNFDQFYKHHYGAAQARTASQKRDSEERKQVAQDRGQTLPVLVCVVGLYVASVFYQLFK